jgi:hypothetical protein
MSLQTWSETQPQQSRLLDYLEDLKNSDSAFLDRLAGQEFCQAPSLPLTPRQLRLRAAVESLLCYSR